MRANGLERALKALFVAFRPQLFMPEPRWARSGVAAVPAVSVCAVLSQRRRGAGTKIAGGAELSGRVTELTQRWVVLEMHVLVE